MRGNPYETRRYLSEYLLLHYGQPAEACPYSFVPREFLRFHQRIREECLPKLGSRRGKRGLDLGCAVGRFTFELGRVVESALGIDNSHAFIAAARRMARRQSLSAQTVESGALHKTIALRLPRALAKGRVEFRVGDALDLTGFPDGSFEIVSAINLLDRLPRPRQLLAELPRLVTSGGCLVLASPFTWLEEYTPRREWLTPEQVQRHLHPAFRLLRQQDMPLVIREHRRKFQLVISQVSVFIRQSNRR